jgi:hypothetical protein
MTHGLKASDHHERNNQERQHHSDERAEPKYRGLAPSRMGRWA